MNVVQEASAKLRMIRDEVTQEGLELRRITDLKRLRGAAPRLPRRLDDHARDR